jgi:CHAD domain-containing protein
MNTGYRLLAAKYIRRQVKQLAEQLAGVCIAEDIEYVHRARVASRRLRAAFQMFGDCFGLQQTKRWRKAIRRIAKRLGDARDRDVQINFLHGALAAFSGNITENFPGITRVLAQLEHEREQLQPKVTKAVKRLRASGVLAEMRRATKRILSVVELTDGKSTPSLVAVPAVQSEIQRHVVGHLDQLLQCQNSLTSAKDCMRHHAMRIAAKRLRYTLEIARPAYPGQLGEFIEALKQVQTLLGEVHDCDVWIEHLDTFATKEKRRMMKCFGRIDRFARLQPGIDYLRQDRHRRREEAFAQIVAYWAELNQQQCWSTLKTIVSAAEEADGMVEKTTNPSDTPENFSTKS